MPTFTTREIIFSKGQLLCAADLNDMRDHVSSIGASVLERYSAGILFGLDIKQTPDAGMLRLTRGAFKLHGHIGSLKEDMHLPVDLGTFRLLLRKGEQCPITSTCGIYTPRTDIHGGPLMSGIEHKYELCWVSVEKGSSEAESGLIEIEVARVCRTDGPPLCLDELGNNKRNSDRAMPRLDALFHPVMSGALWNDDICLLFSPYACMGKYPTLRPVFQQALARIIIEERMDRLLFMTPDLLKGEFPVCDYVGKESLPNALKVFYQHLKEESVIIPEEKGPEMPEPSLK